MRLSFAVWTLAAGVLIAVPAESPLPLYGATVGGPFVHVVGSGESLASLSAQFGIDPAVVARENGFARDAKLLAGQTLALDNRHIVPSAPGAAIVINVPQRMLFHEHEGIALGYPVAVGRRDWPTPLGAFEVVAKEEHPTWDVPLSIQEEMRRKGHRVQTTVPPGPDNPLGRFWLTLSLPGIGIHDTPAPTSIYRAVTHGCIRLHADHESDLYMDVVVGTAGRIVYEPVLLAAIGEELLLEAHRDIYGLLERDALPLVRLTVEELGLEAAIDWAAVRDALARRDGIARRIGRRTT